MSDVILQKGTEFSIGGNVYILQNDVIVSTKEQPPEEPKIEITPPKSSINNPKGHPWFNGTSWGVN